MLIKELKGHSGCKVLLYENNNKKFVRKISASLDYNERLRRQMLKQASFKSTHIMKPEIYNQGEEKGLFFFDMEYVGGTQFNNYISLNTIQNSDAVLEKLFYFVGQNSECENDLTQVMREKISSIICNSSLDIEKYKSYCLNFDWSNISVGFCHGDLTFENILIYKSEIYLIDFLDSFVDTKYIDFSKMLQDIMLMWSWRNCPRVPFIKNIYMYNKLTSFLGDDDKEIVNRFLVLNLLRILPYSDKKTYIIVHNALNFLTEKFKM